MKTFIDLLVEDSADEFADIGVPVQTMFFVGRGTKGVVFDIGQSKIAKFTTDAAEAETAKYLLGKTLKYTWKVYSVDQLAPEQQDYLCQMQPVTCRYRGKPIWLIIGQFLERLPDPDQWRYAIRWLRANGVRKSLLLTADQFRSLMDELDDYQEDSGAHPGLWVEHAQFVLRAYRELVAYGIGFHDLHPGNIRTGPDGPKLVDLGYSKAPGNLKIPILT